MAEATIEQRISAALAPSKEPEAKAEPAPEPEAKSAPEPAPEPEAKAEPEKADDVEVTEPDKSEEEEVVEISSLSDLAAHMGVDVSDLYNNLTIPVSSEGGKVEVTLGEWKDSYQESTKLAKQREELASARAKLEQEQTQARSRIEQQVMEAATLTDAAEKRLLSDMEAVRWQELRESDPSEWAAKKTEFEERRRSIEQAKMQVRSAYEKSTEQHRSALTHKQQEVLRREEAALLAALPQWKDPETRKTETDKLRSYLVESGFKPEEIDSAYDHRLLVMVNKARAYDEQSKRADVAKKKVVKIGKSVLKPGAAKGKETARTDRLSDLGKRLKKSGHIEDAASLIAARMRKR